MKKLFIVIVLLSVLVNGLVGQVVNSFPIPGVTSQSLNNCLLLDQEIWLAGGYPTFHYSSSWTEDYTCNVQSISGVKSQNGQNVVYAFGLDSYNIQNLFKWSNTSKKWSAIPNRPYYLQYGAVVKVVNENCVYLLSQYAVYPKLWKYTGTSFVELYSDTVLGYYEDFLYANNIQVIFSRKNSGTLLRYDVEQDTVTELVTIPDIEGIKDIKSVDGMNFFILSREGNLYRYNINNQTLIDLIICPESEQGWFRNTLEVASTNRLIFLGGSKGIKKIWISNNGDPISEVIYSITNSELSVTSSHLYGSAAIFAGRLGNGEYCFYLRVDFNTGVVESTLPDINVYPNPSKDWIKIDGLTELSNIQIFDVTGKLVLSQEYQVDDRINISNLTVGMYILNIRNSEGVSSKKIIKQ